MKKVLALFLTLALLVPMAMGIKANAADPEIKPFFMVNWDEEGNASGHEYNYVYPMAYMWSSINYSTEEDAYVYFRWKGGTTPEKVAENLKKTFDEFPEGSRYMNWSSLSTFLHYYAEDVFVDKGVPIMVKWLDEMLSHLKSIGGDIDGITIDIEFTDIWSNYISSKAAKDPQIYKRIVDHPTYQERIRPQLVERGFKFYPNVTDLTPEIYSLSDSAGSAYSQSRAIWNAVMRSYIGEIVTEACQPLWKYYPDALVSDYTTKDSKPWNKDQEVSSYGGNWSTAGNMSNENFYMIRPTTSFFEGEKRGNYSTIPGYNSAIYKKTAYHRFQYDNNVAKTSRLSSDNGNISWWIGGYYYGAKGEGTMTETPYYAENLIHLGMLDPQIFLGYVLQQDAKEDAYDDLVLALNIIDDAMAELTRVVGGADREPIVTPPSMNDNYVLSGMHVGGKNVWRLTPDTSLVSVEDFKIEGTDPTFRVGDQTVTFPGGKIIETGDIREVGTCGYWIETAEDVYPVHTRADGFYRNNTGYQENFESFAAGTTYNYNNANPEGSWEIKLNKNIASSSTIVADPTNANNKVLELKGTVDLKNLKIISNVTAGDTYAENQAWEVSVTLPADLPADAELVLLNAANEKKKVNDGGFKIAGGKVYYTQEGEYVELAGVTLTPGEKYTFVRNMNMSDSANFTCDYHIYNAAGEEIAKVKRVAVEELVLPVYSISLSCKNVTGGAVYVDDYRLYPSRVAADFYLYNAKTGMSITETDKAQPSDVAYRLSWLNASDTEKSYTVMAAYYDGDTLVSEEVVKEVKMAANFDGIVTGVVENKQEGKTLKVYLKDNNPPELDDTPPVTDTQTGTGDENQDAAATQPSAPADKTADDSSQKTDEGSNTMLIIIIAGAAVLVIGVLIAVILISKKKKTAPATEEKTEE